MNIRDNTLDLAHVQSVSTADRAISEALQRFSSAPTVSNKVAAVTALQAWFAAVECDATASAMHRTIAA
jgi:hypothetical protein